MTPYNHDECILPYINQAKVCNNTYHQRYPVCRLPAKAEHDGVHSRRRYTADQEVNDIEGNAVSPYGQKLNKCKRTASEKQNTSKDD
jgi:hypothetical protein